jgi:hypothetical protein
MECLLLFTLTFALFQWQSIALLNQSLVGSRELVLGHNYVMQLFGDNTYMHAYKTTNLSIISNHSTADPTVEPLKNIPAPG